VVNATIETSYIKKLGKENNREWARERKEALTAVTGTTGFIGLVVWYVFASVEKSVVGRL
jgi:hypothetical protein